MRWENDMGESDSPCHFSILFFYQVSIVSYFASIIIGKALDFQSRRTYASYALQ